jgi:hypothetical protein
MTAKSPRDPGVLPSRLDPIAKTVKRIGKALKPKSPLSGLEDLAKIIARPIPASKRRTP